jgi:hypothetical protein
MTIILTVYALLILIVWKVIFNSGKNIIVDFEGVFEGTKTFRTPQIVLSASKGNFWFKKVLVPSKNPSKSPIMFLPAYK